MLGVVVSSWYKILIIGAIITLIVLVSVKVGGRPGRVRLNCCGHAGLRTGCRLPMVTILDVAGIRHLW